MKLTKHQAATLRTLHGGAMITVDQTNMPSINGEPLHPQTRYFLTQNRLAERFDKERAVGAQGNGLVISAKGRAAIAEIDGVTVDPPSPPT